MNTALLLDQLLEHTSQLITLLEEERRVLVKGKAAEITDMAKAKLPLSQKVAQLQQQISLNSTSIREFFKAEPQEKIEQLSENLKECSRLNDINGRAIQLMANNTREALKAMIGSDPAQTSETYSAKGKKAYSTAGTSRNITKA